MPVFTFADRQVLYCPVLDPGAEQSVQYANSYRRPVATLLGANLVSSDLCDTASLRPGEGHAPCLDLDHPAALTTDAAARLTLWVDRLGYKAWGTTSDALEAVGLADPDRRDLLRRRSASAERTVLLGAEDQQVDGHCVTQAARMLGPTATGSFAELMNALVACCYDGHPCGTPTAPVTPARSRMQNPWPLRLAVPAILLPSTHNAHLYLEAPLPWEDYAAVLKQLRRTRLLEDGYVGASLDRRGTHLRLPWVLKDTTSAAGRQAA